MPVVRVMGYDRSQYSRNLVNLPEEISAAVFSGMGLFLPEFDSRQFDWGVDRVVAVQGKPIGHTYYVQHLNGNAKRRV